MLACRVAVMPPGFGWPDKSEAWALAPLPVPPSPLDQPGDLVAKRDVHFFNAIARGVNQPFVFDDWHLDRGDRSYMVVIRPELGHMTLEQVGDRLELFAREVMPVLHDLP